MYYISTYNMRKINSSQILNNKINESRIREINFQFMDSYFYQKITFIVKNVNFSTSTFSLCLLDF